MKNDGDRTLDFETIRRTKRARRRRKILLIVAGIVSVLAIIIAVVISQFSQVLDQDRDFWGNFNASHSQQASE